MGLRRTWAGVLAALLVTASAGCSIDLLYHGDLPFPFWLPVPTPQVIGDTIQEHKERSYTETPLMPPIREHSPVFCMDPPSEYDVMRAMKKPSWIAKIPYLYEKHYNNIDIKVEKLVDSVDECRFYPLVGPAQLHHCHYKVTVYFDKLRHSSYPFSWEVKEQDVEVLYMDKDHLHICTSSEMDEHPDSYRDIYGVY